MSQPHRSESPAGYRLPSTAQAVISHGSQHSSLRPYPRGIFIHILDDDTLLNIFDLCRPTILDEGETSDSYMIQGRGWTRERWWYKPAQVCQQWRYLILGSAHHLRLSLVCSRGTPVAEMLEHSPSLPLIIDHVYHRNSITTEDEEGIMLALKHRDHVRCIRLDIPCPNLQKIIMALEDEFPILEFLCMGPRTKLNTSLMFPKSLRAPHLRHLLLWNFALPIGSPLLTTVTSLVTLSLYWISPSVYFHPNNLIYRLSQIPHLETLAIIFHSPVPNRDVNRDLLRRPPKTHIILPKLRWFGFKGTSEYLEALLPFMTAPLLAMLQVGFFNQLTFDLPHLVQFLNTAENLRFSSATLTFEDKLFSAIVYPHEKTRIYALYMHVSCRGLDWQVGSTAQITSVLRPAFSVVENLTLKDWGYGLSLEWPNEADRTQWRDLLRPFRNVKTLRVTPGLINQLSRSLQSEDGESPVELLPELKKLAYYDLREFDDAFTAFIDARRNAGRPVTVVHR